MQVPAKEHTTSAREYVLLALGLGCTLGYVRMCSLGFVGYLTYEMSSSVDSWYVLRTVVELAGFVILAFAARGKWFKLGLKSLAVATVLAMAAAIVFAVDATGVAGLFVAVAGGASMAVLTYVWMLMLSNRPLRSIVVTVFTGFCLAVVIVEGAPLVGPDLGLILAVFAAFASGATAVLLDPDLNACEPDGRLDASEKLRVPWLTVVMIVACGFFSTVLYGVSEYMTWLYDWQPNYVVFAVAVVAVIGATTAIMFRSRGWMHVVWVPMFVLFALAIVFACLPVRTLLQIAVGLLMAAVFCSVFLVWLVFPSLFSTLKAPHACAAAVLLACANSQLASLVGDALGAVLPRSMQNLGSVAGIMAIVVAVLFAGVFVVSRNRQGSVGAWPSDAVESPARRAIDPQADSGEEDEVEAEADSTEQASASDAEWSETVISLVDAQDAGAADVADAVNPANTLKTRLDELVDEYGLTSREAEVALYTVQGFSGAYIAEKLAVSSSTVRFHQQNIYRKCDVHSRNELIELVAAE